MACSQVKSMIFRIYEYKRNNKFSAPKYYDTGKEFSITEQEIVPKFGLTFEEAIKRPYTLAYIMLPKIYEFSTRLEWPMVWTVPNKEGYIGYDDNPIWHIKRVL